MKETSGGVSRGYEFHLSQLTIPPLTLPHGGDVQIRPLFHDASVN